MKTSISIILLVCASSLSNALFGQQIYTAKEQISYTFKASEGTNAVAVAWNSDKQVYYTLIAGNSDYPLETFSSTGSFLYTQAASVDARGLWYNSTTKTLEGNGAGEKGYFSMSIGSNLKPNAPEITIVGQNQPDFNSVGAFDVKKKKIYYYQDGTISIYSQKKGKLVSTINVQSIPDIEAINYTSVIYTNRKGEELGLLDFESKKVYLFDLKGNFKAIVSLPDNAVTHESFRFSFANSMIWLYDASSRTWKSYSF